MGRVFKLYLDGPRVFECRKCSTHLSTRDAIISKNFQGRSGKAYLFDLAVNIVSGHPEERVLMTGVHVVVDIFCKSCWNPVGWRYEEAQEESQKYKEGKYILELAKMFG
ncbi:unnamed protein product [Albugo candida]|uniref:Protein yippee-like n=1 Tax=Albugo candida TaxID=65357 RepID=A0A024GE64_9STRA|nr:unnamed protein product [Albugo candida]|eukprot:CCI45053.1 unnamed protein product [Albugo candida]